MTHYSPKQVAARLGVSESSVKRWLDQGAVPVVRTAGGHRRVSEGSLEQLLERLKTTSGFPRLSAAGGDFGGSSDGGGAAIAEESSAVGSLEDLCNEFQDSLASGNEVRCRQLLNSAIDRGLSPSTAADLLITPSMHCLGSLWESGDLEVYQERRACGIASHLIAGLKRQLPLSEASPVAIGGAPEGDTYQLPTALVELALLECGWRAHSLGNDLPMRDFRKATDEYQPRLIWVSLSYLADEERFVEAFNGLADQLPPATTLLIGGRAANDSLRPRLRYTAHCDSLRQLIALGKSLLAAPTNSRP